MAGYGGARCTACAVGTWSAGYDPTNPNVTRPDCIGCVAMNSMTASAASTAESACGEWPAAALEAAVGVCATGKAGAPRAGGARSARECAMACKGRSVASSCCNAWPHQTPNPRQILNHLTYEPSLPVCKPGFGGPAIGSQPCQKCAKGTYAANATLLNRYRDCTACPAGAPSRRPKPILRLAEAALTHRVATYMCPTCACCLARRSEKQAWRRLDGAPGLCEARTADPWPPPFACPLVAGQTTYYNGAKSASDCVPNGGLRFQLGPSPFWLGLG